MHSWLQAGGAWNGDDVKTSFLYAALRPSLHVWLDAANNMISMMSNSLKHGSLLRGDKVVSDA